MQDSQRQTFLQEIFANPEDDTPRLIYADWLDEQGDPRGEFIRIQCELAKLKNKTREKILTKRVNELFQEHGPKWVTNLGIDPEDSKKIGTKFTFHRGFAELSFEIPPKNQILSLLQKGKSTLDEITEAKFQRLFNRHHQGHWKGILIRSQQQPEFIIQSMTKTQPLWASWPHLFFFSLKHKKLITKLPENQKIPSGKTLTALGEVSIDPENSAFGRQELHQIIIGKNEDNQDIAFTSSGEYRYSQQEEPAGCQWWSLSTCYYLLVQKRD